MSSLVLYRNLSCKTNLASHYRRYSYMSRILSTADNRDNERQRLLYIGPQSTVYWYTHKHLSVDICLTYNRQCESGYGKNQYTALLSDIPHFLYNFHDTATTSQIRPFHTSHCLWKEQESKVEQTVKALKEKLTEEESAAVAAAASGEHKDDVPKPTHISMAPDSPSKAAAVAATEPATGPSVATTVATVQPARKSLWVRVKDELVHYYHGFRLFFLDMKVAISLLWQVSTGHTLSRRERRQLVRTVADMFRMLPFLVFVTVPFMEFLLPVYLTVFPSMLPSTFQTESRKQEKLKKKLKVKLEMAKFLHETIKESAVEMKQKDAVSEGSSTVKEFGEFMTKIRSTGEEATTEEIRKFSKFFEDELTLDNMNRDQLVALCRIVEVQSFGTNNFLRFQLRMKLRALKNDDRMIRKEGIEHMSLEELQTASRMRGMRATDLPIWRLRSQLAQWLELHLDEQISPSLLLLSRALFIPEYISPERQLSSTLKEFTGAIEGEAKLKIADIEGVEVDPKEKLDVLRSELEAIKKEKEEREQEMKEKELRDLMEREEMQKQEKLESLLFEVKPDHLVSRLPTQKVLKQQTPAPSSCRASGWRLPASGHSRHQGEGQQHSPGYSGR